MNTIPTMTRRRWLQLTAMSALSGASLSALHAQGKRPLGVQLYTVREQLGPKAAATLKAIAHIGYKELELGRGDLAQLAPIAKSYGLEPISIHIEAPLVTGNWTAWSSLEVPEGYTLERALDEARGHGVRYAVVSYLMPSERAGGLPFYETLADALNRAGEVGRRAGVAIGYHNHGFEFEPLPNGRRPLDVLMERTDPALVRLELDVFWVGITGADPVDLLKQYGGRVSLVHLKDKSRDAGPETDERKVKPATFKEVGSGALDFGAILKTAERAGVQHYFVEQDHTPGDPLASLRKSYEYLQTVG
jgi:sugar phosphate isomerase/epimerase